MRRHMISFLSMGSKIQVEKVYIASSKIFEEKLKELYKECKEIVS